jgi:hypothetical protein
MATIDISKLNKSEVLAALYNASKPQGLGFLHSATDDMTVEQAKAIIDRCPPDDIYFDYLKGRVMKVHLEGDTLDTWGYDRDNGQGAAERALAKLKTQSAPAPVAAA